MAYRIIAKMARSVLRKSGRILVLIVWLVLLILSYSMIIIFRIRVDLRHIMPILGHWSLVSSIRFPLVIFMVKCIMGFVTKKGISVLVVVRLVTCNRIILLRLLLEQYRFLLLLLQSLHQKVALLVSRYYYWYAQTFLS